jgi:hypothetical protein
MKHLSSLTALLVGLSLTTASYAQQAGGAKAKKKPTQTAVQGDDQPSGTAPAPAAPAEPEPAPSPAPVAEPTPGVVTIGGTTTGPTGSDAPTNDDKKKEAKKEERRWGGSAIVGYTAMSTSTIFRGQTQYADPTVDSSLWLMPRYNINDAWQLRGRIIFNYEWTNSDTTVTKNEPRFSDTTLQLVYKKLPEIATIKPVVGVQVGLPTSPESRAKTMLFAPGALVGLAKSFEHIGPGEIDVSLGGIYSHPVYQSTNAEVRGERPYPIQCAGGGDCSDLLTGTMNASDVIAYTASVGYKIGKVTPSIFYLGSSQWVYHPKDDPVTIPGGQSVSVADTCTGVPDGTPGCQGRSNVRQAGYLAASVDYDVVPWLTAEVGYSIYRNFLTEDGKYGNPFFDRYQDMRVFIGATMDPDEFIQALQGRAKDNEHSPDGVPRRTNAQSRLPVMRY